MAAAPTHGIDWVTATDPEHLPDECRALVTTSKAGPEHQRGIRSWAIRRNVPWLPVRVDGGRVTLGPAAVPGHPGCPTCAEYRRHGNLPEGPGRQALHEHYGDDHLFDVSSPPNPLLGAVVSALAADEALRLLRDPRTARTRDALLELEPAEGTTGRHPLVASPDCPDCAELPRDTPERATITLTPARKAHPGQLRTRDLVTRRTELEQRYVDPETGVVATVDSWSRPSTAGATARLSPATAVHAGQHGHGRAFDFGSARLTALLEALERLVGQTPRGRRSHVLAAHRDVAEHAVNPVDLGLYPEERYRLPDFPFVAHSPDRERRWVWGYSFRRGEPLLVPESHAYYGLGCAAEPLAYETSSGCALGGCLTEAILHALLEVAERDSFLMTWYARLPVPQVDLSTAVDRRIPLLAERARYELGYRLHAFATTLEQQVPSFWVMAVEPEDEPQRAKALCGAGAHPDPERALLRALGELTAFLPARDEHHDHESAARMLADSDRVRSMDDHSVLYGHPAAFDRLSFLFDGPLRGLPELAARWKWPEHDDLSTDLAEMITRYLGSGLEVLAIDQTSPELAAEGLAAAKVLVPGTLPMTFGHRFRRTTGIPRLHTVPRLLGYRDRELRPDEINPYPHPFP
ncbi:ribosomal protein S12 methylthiotransferase accessory factor [Saccharopolyspora lacisalsi]|uniref:Ribosomal protein S12 methylthiotransferase accessory factor n=1 Tax=Halosaccharopolyspora lacisalsi TaxID=1000566 RepID=A0A839DZI2_9PSEU|nr:TOMM precursor leader peptide-binding protein [Halosaccharopolyspora lacisalsi]MBA8826423.1 ribosomal protein S12 methylthiotransferase accessory factor [Halosaccharopolyspora lacisalsi]